MEVILLWVLEVGKPKMEGPCLTKAFLWCHKQMSHNGGSQEKYEVSILLPQHLPHDNIMNLSPRAEPIWSRPHLFVLTAQRQAFQTGV